MKGKEPEAPEQFPEPSGDSMVAQYQLARSGGVVRIIVPREFGEDPDDVPAFLLIATQLYDAAKLARSRRPDGIELPSKPRLLVPTGEAQVKPS